MKNLLYKGIKLIHNLESILIKANKEFEKNKKRIFTLMNIPMDTRLKNEKKYKILLIVYRMG
jgi:hypothetical protein